MNQDRSEARSHTDVSVVIPVAGDAPFLADALASLDRSVVLEVLLVEDGPKRNRRLPGDLGIRYLSTERREGPSAARNIGIQEAVAEFVAFLDADDIHTRGHLDRCLDALRLNRADAVAGVARWVDSHGEPLGGADWEWEEFSRDGALGSLLLRNQVATPTVVARRDLLMKLNGFNPELSHAEDYELWLRIADAGSWAYISTVEAHVRRHAANTSRDLAAHLTAERQILEKWDLGKVRDAFARLYPDSAVAQARAFAGHSFKICNDALLREAAAHLERADPADCSGAFLLGTRELQLGKIAEAIQRLERWCGMPHASAELWNNLGVAFGRDGRTDAARHAFALACSLRPDYRDPAFNLELLDRGRPGELRITGRLLRRALPPF